MLACCIVVVYKMMLRMYPIPSLTDDISAIKYHFGLIEISISVFIWSLFRCNGHCSVSLLLSCFGFPVINGSLSQIQGPLLLLLLLSPSIVNGDAIRVNSVLTSQNCLPKRKHLKNGSGLVLFCFFF